MNNEQIALLELYTVGGIGAMIFVAGLLFSVLQWRKRRRCTKAATGHIIRYSFPGQGRIVPVVSYCVDGQEYVTTRKFKGIITTRVNSPSRLYIDNGAYVSDRDYLHVPMRAVTNLKEMAEKLWPIGQEMKVFYNPGKPRQAYAERLPRRLPLVSLIFAASGTGVMILSVIMYFLMR